jgi:hypothetical protein
MRSAKSGSWLRSSSTPEGPAPLPGCPLLRSTELSLPPSLLLLLLLLLLLEPLLLVVGVAAACWRRCQKRDSSWSSSTVQSICTGMSAAAVAAGIADCTAGVACQSASAYTESCCYHLPALIHSTSAYALLQCTVPRRRSQ